MGDGKTAREAVPSLDSVLDGESDWLAIIACDLREEGARFDGDGVPDVHFDNPYDFVDRYDWDPRQPVQESPHALVRLCQILGGLPDKTANTGTNELVEQYRTGLPRPRRIICVTPRAFDEDGYMVARRELKDLGCIEAIDNDFWDRNDYPASTRFVVFDWQEAAPVPQGEQRALLDLAAEANEMAFDPLVEERAQRLRWIRFWSCVLSFATVDVSSADLKPYRLYRMDAEVTQDKLRESFAPRYSEWVGMRSLIDEQIVREERRLEDLRKTGGDMPQIDATIEVKGLIRNKSSYLDRCGVRLIRDRPEDDLGVWGKQRKIADGVVDDILRIPVRELRHSVDEYKRRSVFGTDELENCVLTEDQIYDLEEEVSKEEIRLACDTDKGAFSERTHRRTLDVLSGRVVDAIEERPRPGMHRRSVLWIASGFLFGLVAFTLVLDPVRFQTGLTIASFVPLVLALLFAVVVLFWQRFNVRDSYDEVECWLNTSVERSNEESERVSARLSRYARVRRMHAVLARQRQLSASTQLIRSLKEKLVLLLEQMDTVVTTVGEPDLDYEYLDRVAYGPWSALAGRLKDEDFFYAADACAVERPLNPELDDLRTADVPFDFIDTITLLPLRVFVGGSEHV